MNLSDLVPKFRIEIRRAGSPKRAPWEIAELAHTDNHVAAKSPYWKNNPDLETRVVPNLPAAPQPERLDPPAPVAAAAPVAVAPLVSISSGSSHASNVETIQATPLAPTAAAAEPELAPLPFKSGDRLQDKNLADHPEMHVAEINPDGRHGFNVECPLIDHPVKKWFVPANAAHNFQLFDAPKKAAAKPKAAPKHKPAAANK